MTWLSQLVLGFVGRKVRGQLEKRNWVTKTGGVSLIFSGLAMITSGLAGDSLDVDLIVQGIAVIGGGVTALGARRAIQEAKDAADKKG